MGDNQVVISNVSEEGQKLEAIFLPWKGMNFISYKNGERQAIDQSTKPLFEERYAGLGAMIGPHFHHRKAEVIPKIANESLFPHIARLRAKGTTEPFSHGIGRYAPWKIEEMSEHHILATLNGKDEWNGVPLASLEGQDFTMKYLAKMTPKGLSIDLSCISDTDSVVGLHTYYRLDQNQGTVIAKVQPEYIASGETLPIPSSWNYAQDHTMTFDLTSDSDFGFHPFTNPLAGDIELVSLDHKVKIHYESDNQENSWQLWHPKDASFVCIEPLSAKDPRHPHLSVSQIKIIISIQSVL